MIESKIKDLLKSVIRNVFRYKLTSIFFMIGQLIMYVTIFGALGIYNQAYQKEQDRLNAQYDNRIEMSVSKLDDSDILTYCITSVEAGNVILDGALSFFFREKNCSNRAEMILAQSEAIPYEMVSGRLPGSEPEDEGKCLIALGRYQFQYAYEENGSYYVTMENERYEVVGVIGNEYSDYLDYKIVFNINCIGDNILQTINEMQSYTINLGSNETMLDETYKEVYNNIINISQMTNIESKALSGDGESTVTGTLKKEKLRVNEVVYVFCLLNCMLMSEFWIIQRNKEFAIKRTYGYGKLRIIFNISRDISLLSIVSLFLYSVIHFILANIFHISLYRIYMDGKTVLIVIIINIIAIVVTLFYPIYKIMCMSPAIILKDVE